VKKFAAQIAAGPPIAIRAVKQTLFGSEKDALSEALEAEVQHQMRCFASDDCLEGIHAFFEKRPPKFQGR
jgi:enoyl-CoA hydratase/carnithine racemase